MYVYVVFFKTDTSLPKVFAAYHALCVNSQCQCHCACIYSNWVDFAIYNLGVWLPLSSYLTSNHTLTPFSCSQWPARDSYTVYYYTAHLTSPSMVYSLRLIYYSLLWHYHCI